MTPINNSDTAWLITADFNQENNKFHQELRNDIISPDVNDWFHELPVIYNNTTAGTPIRQSLMQNQSFDGVADVNGVGNPPYYEQQTESVAVGTIGHGSFVGGCPRPY